MYLCFATLDWNGGTQASKLSGLRSWIVLGRRVHEIRIILGNVAALGEPTMPTFVPRHLCRTRDYRSLTVIRKDLSAHRGELSPMLLKTRQHRKIALIQHRTAVPLDTAGARALLLLRSTVLRRRVTAREKRQSAGDEYKLFHENLLMQRRAAASSLRTAPQAPCVQMVPSVLAPIPSGGVSLSDHHRNYPAQYFLRVIPLIADDRDSDWLPQDWNFGSRATLFRASLVIISRAISLAGGWL